MSGLELLPDGVVIAGADGMVTSINQVAAHWLGLDPATGVGRHLSEVMSLVDHHGRAWFAGVQPYEGLSTRKGVPEQAWLAPSGEEVLVVARLHRPAPGHPISTVAITLRSGRARARLDRDRSDLVATVAHELRSPLTGVKGFVQALLAKWDQLNDEQKKLMLTTVNADSDRLTRLIAELLDVARIDTGRLHVTPRPVDATVLIDRVVASVSATTSREIRVEYADGTPQVLADPDKFTQVVINLVVNAVHHGEGAVVVSWQPDPHDEEVELRVEDSGPGIPVEMRRRVFTKFWTGASSGGSGLGLFVVHGLVKAHGGEIQIGDSPGGGARVTVWWPIAPAD